MTETQRKAAETLAAQPEIVVWNGAIMVREAYPSGSVKVDGIAEPKYGFRLRPAMQEEAAQFKGDANR